MTGCASGFANCDGLHTNGCESKLSQDPSNCGTCGTNCLGGDCVSGKCQPFEIGKGENPWSLAVSGNILYVSNKAWSSIDSMSKFGSGFTQLGTFENTNGISLGAGYIYFGANSSILRMPASGGSTTTVLVAPAVDVSVDNDNIYWTESSAGIIRKRSIAGGAVSIFANNQLWPLGIVSDGSSVYWTNSGSGPNTGGVYKKNVSNGSMSTLLGTTEGCYMIAVDGTHVYVTNHIQGTVSRIPVIGGMLETIATGQTIAQGIAVDATSVYWSRGDNKIMKMAKPKLL